MMSSELTGETVSVRQSRASGKPVSAKIKEHGLGETYRPGDTATGYLVIENTGDRPIGKVTVKVTVYPERLFGLPAGHKTETFDVELPPGGATRLEYHQEIPREIMGISTKGSYRLDAEVAADGVSVATLKKHVDVI